MKHLKLLVSGKPSYLVGPLVILLLIGSCNQENDSIKAEFKALTESVYASASVQPDSLYKVYSMVSGIITDVYVEEGSDVKTGQPIVQIKNESPKLTVENARLSLQLARENLVGSGSVLKTLENKIQSAELTHKQDSLDFKRQERLINQNIGSQREYEQRKIAFDLSNKNLQTLRKEYSRTKTELRTALNQAENNYKNAQLGKEEYEIQSLMTGTVYQFFKEKGEVVNPAEPIATIGKKNSFLIKLTIDEVDITKVEVGQTAIIKLDAYEDEVFEVKISRILPQKDTRTQTFTVEAKFKEQPKKLYSGLSGEANIVISQKENVLVIPRDYVTEDNKVKTTDGLVDVETGLRNFEFVEIISGIDSSTEILRP